MTAHLPLDIARCQPQACHCPQADTCARATDWPTGDDIRLLVIDVSVALETQKCCPMFIDRRGVELMTVPDSAGSENLTGAVEIITDAARIEAAFEADQAAEDRPTAPGCL